ncbi:MAG: LPS export ABC transporter periplasmic protein LptC [bacterium]|nr:LPS export ABC transporter periplasmic protein LptC [bacterium]
MRYTLLALLLCISSELAAAPQNQVTIETDAFIFNTQKQSVAASKSVYINYGNLNIQSDSAAYSSIKNTLEIKGNVLAQQHNTTIRSNLLISNLKTGIIYAPQPMIFKHNEIFGKSENSHYNTRSQVLTLKGKPQITEGKNTLEADEITFDFKTNKVKSRGKTKISVSETTDIPNDI